MKNLRLIIVTALISAAIAAVITIALRPSGTGPVSVPSASASASASSQGNGGQKTGGGAGIAYKTCTTRFDCGDTFLTSAPSWLNQACVTSPMACETEHVCKAYFKSSTQWGTPQCAVIGAQVKCTLSDGTTGHHVCNSQCGWDSCVP
jgi:hypothetical protein